MAKQLSGRYDQRDKIINYIKTGDIDILSEKDKQYYEKLKFAYQLWATNPVARNIVPILIQTYKMSQATAYEYVEDAKVIFSPLDNVDAIAAEKYLYEDIILAMRLAKENSDLNAWNKAHSNMVKLIEMVHKRSGTINYKTLGRNTYNIQIIAPTGTREIELESVVELTEAQMRMNAEAILSTEIDEKVALSIMQS